MTKNYANTVYLYRTCFQLHPAITDVDCSNVPWMSNSMSNAFANCSALNSVSNINPNVTNMSFAFSECYNLKSAPSIPYGVTNVFNAFSNCNTMLTAPSSIPSTVIDVRGIFRNCQLLTSIPDRKFCFSSPLNILSFLN